ncbi:MAG TPA: histidine ammonia-lyase [Bacillota bacterium]|nr:histidine ammonia-lyase [Bacillota bacterium]
MKQVVITGNGLSLQHIVAVSRDGAEVTLAEDARLKVRASRKYVEELVRQERPVYGITTGFGKFCDTFISAHQTAELQHNLIVSHACGVGQPYSTDVVRAMMLLRVNALAKGYSGVREDVLDLLVSFLNERVHPVVPCQGSLGASGDLAPLAHMVLPMLGEGLAEVDGEVVSGAEALLRRGIPFLTLSSKEGLALINGTQAMGANLALALHDARITLKTVLVAAGLTHQALRGITAAYDERVSLVRPHPGQRAVALSLVRLLKDSVLTTVPGELRVQDAYSLRCIPQVYGACLTALCHAEQVAEVEFNSATDNPLVFAEQDDVISAGNFHGEPLALVADYLSMAVAEIANMSERRIERLVNPQLSGLPAFLTRSGGVNSGFMIAQYTAAALVSENKVLAHPASVDSIPSSANQEDHVSMGGMACRKLRDIVTNTQRVVGIELITACQAVDFQGPSGLSPATSPAYHLVRREVMPLGDDRVMYPDLNSGYGLVQSGRIVDAVEECMGDIIAVSDI